MLIYITHTHRYSVMFREKSDIMGAHYFVNKPRIDFGHFFFFNTSANQTIKQKAISNAHKYK